MPKLAGVTHDHVDAGGVRLHVAEAGEGEPVVMVHGWPQNWWMWRHLIPPLAEHYRVICPDLRGYGWSEAPREGYEKDRLADDVLALMDAMGLDRVRLVGHDWGGVIGFDLCLRAPERIDRYLALGTGHPFARPSLRSVASLWRMSYQVLLASPFLGERVMRDGRVVRMIARDQIPRAWDQRAADVFASQYGSRDHAWAGVQTYRSFLLRDLPSSVLHRDGSTVNVPILFLHGEKDPVIRPHMLEGYEEQAPRMRLEILPGVGHFVPEEVPDLVRDRALEFFGGDTPG